MVDTAERTENTTQAPRPDCCHIECHEPADWEIWIEPDVYNVTFACQKHVGEMIEPGCRNRVYPPGWEA